MGTGRKKISIQKVENIKHRRVTFTKRRQGLFKKADQLSGLTGCRVASLVYSPAMKPFPSLLEEADAIGRTFGNPNALSDITSVMEDDEIVIGEELVIAGLYDDDDACSNVHIDPEMQQYNNNNYASSNTTKNDELVGLNVDGCSSEEQEVSQLMLMQQRLEAMRETVLGELIFSNDPFFILQPLLPPSHNTTPSL